MDSSTAGLESLAILATADGRTYISVNVLFSNQVIIGKFLLSLYVGSKIVYLSFFPFVGAIGAWILLPMVCGFGLLERERFAFFFAMVNDMKLVKRVYVVEVEVEVVVVVE